MNSKHVLVIGILVSAIFIITCILTKLDQIVSTTNITKTDPIKLDQSQTFIPQPINTIDKKEQNQTDKNITNKKIINNLEVLLKDRSISFYNKSANLTPEGEKSLNEIISLIKDLNSTILYISIDYDINNSSNITLKNQRALSVKEYLINKGIKTKIISNKSTINNFNEKQTTKIVITKDAK